MNVMVKPWGHPTEPVKLNRIKGRGEGFEGWNEQKSPMSKGTKNVNEQEEIPRPTTTCLLIEGTKQGEQLELVNREMQEKYGKEDGVTVTFVIFRRQNLFGKPTRVHLESWLRMRARLIGGKVQILVRLCICKFGVNYWGSARKERHATNRGRGRRLSGEKHGGHSGIGVSLNLRQERFTGVSSLRKVTMQRPGILKGGELQQKMEDSELAGYVKIKETRETTLDLSHGREVFNA